MKHRLIVAALSTLLWLSPFSVFAETLHTQPTKLIPSLSFDPERVVLLRGDIRQNSANKFISNIMLLEAQSNDPITLIIDSPGGNIAEGLAIIEQIEKLESPLTCIVEHQALSMAANIAVYCPKLYVTRFSMIMFHEASYSIAGNESVLKRTMDNINKYLANLTIDLARKLGISHEVYLQKQHDEWWMNATEAVTCGFASAIIEHVVYNEDLSL